MNALSSKADLLGGLSPIALAAQLDRLEMRDRELDERQHTLTRAEQAEADQIYRQTQALAELILHSKPSAPADALTVIAAALLSLDYVRCNVTAVEEAARRVQDARHAIIRSLDVLTIDIGVSYQEIGANYFMSAAGEPGAPPERDEPDADLLAACAAHAAAHAAMEAHFDIFAPADIPDGDPEIKGLMTAHSNAVALVCRLPAVTDAGHKARAGALALIAHDVFSQPDDEDGALVDRLQAALLRDLARPALRSAQA